jgi:multidrug efflux pump
MLLSDISVKRPVFATVLSLLLMAFGLVSIQRLPVREFPDIDPPVVSIDTAYRGASAATVEARVTKLIEDQVAGVPGVRWISSRSSDGLSQVVMEFNLDRDVDAAANDVRDRVSRVVQDLPDEVEAPEIFKVDSDEDPIVWYNLSSTVMNVRELSDYADRYIVDQLSAVDGVARVMIGGEQRYAMRIWLDRVALAARRLTTADIEAALRAQNVELPAGALESTERDYTLRLARAYATEDDFRKLVVAKAEDGHLVRLGEVARVELSSVEPRIFFRGNGEPQIGLGIIRQSTANTLEVAEATREKIDQIKTTLPRGTTLHYSYDGSVFIKEAIFAVYETLAIAVLLVIGVIYLFLGSVRATIVPAVTVPVCLIASFSLLYLFGYSINLLTLLALVLAIGLVVDDAIVVLENIYRRIQKGETPLIAAYRGARQVGFAVLATTAVLVAVFVPIVFLEGNVGRLFAELGVAVASAVALSALVALSFSVMLASKLLRPASERKGRLQTWVDGGMTRLSDRYTGFLTRAVRRPALVGALVVAAFGLIFLIGSQVKEELVPPEDRGAFFMQMQGPQGAGFDYTKAQMMKAEQILLPFIEKGEAKRVMLRAPSGFTGLGNFDTGAGMIVLQDWKDRERSTFEIMDDIRGQFAEKMPGVQLFAIMRQGISGSSGRQVQFVVGGSTFEELARYRDVMMEKARANPGLIAPDVDFKETRPQMEVFLDRDRAADLGVPSEEVGATLESMIGSRKVTTFSREGEEYDVIVQGRRSDRESPTDLSNIYVRSRDTGTLIPLSNLVRLEERADAKELNRYNRMRAITVSAGLAQGYTLGEALDYLEQAAAEELPSTARVGYKGESLEFKESSGAVLFTFFIALLVVFLVLAAQFESFIHPFVIMLSVPLAILGAVAGLWALGSTLNIYSQVGIIILIGISAKNGILIVEFANQLRDAGRTVDEAILEACRIRLRPIIMTSLATAIGAVPLALASGAGSESRVTLGIVVCSGVFVATVLTLVVVPVFYRLLAPYTRSPHAVERQLEALQEPQA